MNGGLECDGRLCVYVRNAMPKATIKSCTVFKKHYQRSSTINVDQSNHMHSPFRVGLLIIIHGRRFYGAAKPFL